MLNTLVLASTVGHNLEVGRPLRLASETRMRPVLLTALVAEWDEEEYHLEVVPDAKVGTVTVYVYGNHDDLHKGTAKAIDAKSLTLTVNADKAVVVKLEPKPAAGDPAGKASVFTGKHAVFTKDAKLSGSVSGKVGTKPYTGDFGK